MATRIRSLKPDFFKNEDLAELAPLCRLLFQGLWCLADSQGRLKDRPKRIKAEVLPYDECDIDDLLSHLANSGFIVRYRVGDSRVIEVINFLKHQRLSGKEAQSASEFPSFSEADEIISGPLYLKAGSNGEAMVKQRGSDGEAVNVQERKGKEGFQERKGEEFSPSLHQENNLERIDPNFDESIDVVWKSLSDIALSADPSADVKLTPHRRRDLSDRLITHPAPDVIEAYRWCWTSPNEKAVAIRSAWKGIGTFLKADKLDDYVGLSKLASAWTANPRGDPRDITAKLHGTGARYDPTREATWE